MLYEEGAHAKLLISFMYFWWVRYFASHLFIPFSGTTRGVVGNME